ncbi:SCO4225 family membrane protein [Streptomyces sp. NPDC003023]|uniref:SCO4225 family membrane protein n=1 Tax=Streptomyces sp. NPDC003023 TaxID=3364675 RepID=UPI0036A4BCF0
MESPRVRGEAPRARLTALARLTFGNRPAQVHPGLVVVAAVHIAIDTAFVHHEDAWFAGVWLLLSAAPTIFGFMAVGMLLGGAFAESAAFLHPARVLSVLLQALALWLFTRLLTGQGRAARPRGA